MPFGIKEGERFIDAELRSKSGGFSAVYLTSESRDLSIKVGFKLGETAPSEAVRRVEIARLFNGGSIESSRVVGLLIDTVLVGGWCVALPADEVPSATGFKVSRRDLDMAVEEGFVTIQEYPGVKSKLVELAPKLFSFLA